LLRHGQGQGEGRAEAVRRRHRRVQRLARIGMAKFVGRRLFYLLPVLLAVSLFTFLIASLLPGDLAYTILGDQATPEKLAALRAQMGLDLPIWQRYGLWLWDVLHGDLGRSFRTGETVLAAVLDRLPVSIEIGRASCRERGEVWGVGGVLKNKEKN